MTTEDLRMRVAQIRRELAQVTEAYHTALCVSVSSELTALLRRRCELTRQLLEAQSYLLLGPRDGFPRAEPQPLASCVSAQNH